MLAVKNHSKIISLLLIILFLRTLISFLPSFEFDQSAFRFWSQRLVELGPANFYSQEVFTNNPLGYLYFLWGIGLLKEFFLLQIPFNSQSFDILLKLPNNIADILASFLIYLLLKKKLKEKWAIAASLSYALNPVSIFDSAIWGQYDSLAFLSILFSTYLILIKKQPEVATIFFAIAWILKPQSLTFAPVFGLTLLTQYNFSRWFYSFSSFMVTTLILYLPFFPSNPINGILYVNSGSTQLFNCTTCFALNFWGIFGNWKNDNLIFLFLPLVFWGIILLIISYIFILFSKPFKIRFQLPLFYLTAALSSLAFFTLLTRMHERYFFPSLPFLLISAALLKNLPLFIFYIFFSILFTVNIYIPYAYYNSHLDLPFQNLLQQNFHLLSFIEFAAFITLLSFSTRLIYKYRYVKK